MQRLRPLVSLALAAPLAMAACRSSEPQIDWSAKENFFIVEKADKNPDESVRLEFHSLVDVPARAVYDLLSQPENYASFIEGVTDSGTLSSEGNGRLVHITQNVVGR